MRLLELTARNFRGFGPAPVTINLDYELALLYGPNGYGKTSVAEAVEWLFYGSTKRRKRGEAYSASEYSGTFANAHAVGATQVAARVRFADGRELTLMRQIASSSRSEESATYIDGNRAEFSTLGLNVQDAVYPVIVQHGLQTFIHSRPKERRDAISAALGLDELTALKTALDGARKSFQTSPPSAVVEARNRLRTLAQPLGQIPEAAKTAVRWQKPVPEIDRSKDIFALAQAAKSLTSSSSDDIPALTDALKLTRIEAERSVFDTSKLPPPSVLLALAEQMTRECDAAQPTFSALDGAIAARIAAMAAAYSAERLAFWEIGLKIAPEGEECPMCEAPTLTAEQRILIQTRLDNAQEARARAQALDQAIASTRRRIQQIEATAPRPPTFAENDRIFLHGLMVGAETVLEDFLGRLDSFAAAAHRFEEARIATTNYLDGLSTRLSSGLQAPEVIEDQKRVPGGMFEAAREFAEAIRDYADGAHAFQTLIAARVSSTDIVKRIDAVLAALMADAEFRTIEAYDRVLAESKTLMQAAEAFLQRKQAELLGQRGAEVQGWYDMLNPGADVAFAGMEPGNDQLKLHAQSFGVRMSAAANLSECQMNCLGLAVWMMRATTPGSPFSFIVFDDPIQSMDDDHTEAFIGSVVPKLLDEHGKQVIVLSHVERITSRLQELCVGRRTKLYHFDGYSKDGPSITVPVRLHKLVSEIKGLANGNDANREYAVDRLRVLVEQIVREIHVKRTGNPAPPAYNDANPGDLLKLFQTIPGTTPEEHNALRDTVGFASPAHHTPVGYTPPLKTNILPHLDRLTGLMKKYNL
jgi:hypothetical protein